MNRFVDKNIVSKYNFFNNRAYSNFKVQMMKLEEVYNKDQHKAFVDYGKQNTAEGGIVNMGYFSYK